MAILQIECGKCHQSFSLRGYIEKEDLLGTEYESLMNTITDNELCELSHEAMMILIL